MCGDDDDDVIRRANSESQADIEQRLSSDGVKRQVEYLVYLSDKVFSLRACDFKNGENCLLYAAKYFPLVTPLAKDPLYRALHPYSAPSEKAFRSWNVGKQMAAEVRENVAICTPESYSRQRLIKPPRARKNGLIKRWFYHPYIVKSWEIGTILVPSYAL